MPAQPTNFWFLKRINWYLLSTSLIFFNLVLIGCNPQLPGLNPTDPLPLELRVNAQPDSLLAPPNELDFSVVSKVGHGPGGTLIRWNLLGSPQGNYTAYSYDQQSRLIGSCEHTSFGYDELRLVRYQGPYLAWVYTGFDRSASAGSPKTVDALGWISKYEYDAQSRLAQVLVYQSVAGSFKLNLRIQYEYNAAGQLQLTRHTTSLAFGSIVSYQGIYPVEVRYWEQGDVSRLEVYNPNQAPIKPTNRVFYNQVTNPRASLHLWPQNLLTVHYPIGSGVNSPEFETFQYRYGYDPQGRLSSVQQRSINDYYGSNTQWTGWSYKEEFVYAP